MIYLQIKGGLGNQLFQYSVGYFLKKQFNTELCLDFSSAAAGRLLKKAKIKKNYSFRDIQLECFSLDIHRSQSSVTRFVVDQVIQKVSKTRGFTGNSIAPVIKEDGTDCRQNNIGALNAAGRSKNVIVTGYWQNINYINPIREDLVRQFRISLDTGTEYNEFLKQIHTSISVGVHVRRGDFVALGWNKGADYYRNAMMVARQMLPDAKFYFFSDDQEWVKNNLYEKKDSIQVEIHEDHPDVKEFDLLRHCQHQIISESTFGWWAAYLNENCDKQIFIPFDCRGDIWLDEWNRVEYSKN